MPLTDAQKRQLAWEEQRELAIRAGKVKPTHQYRIGAEVEARLVAGTAPNGDSWPSGTYRALIIGLLPGLQYRIYWFYGGAQTPTRQACMIDEAQIVRLITG